MFQNILRSLSGSFADLGRWEPTADRSEAALRSGLEKAILFVLCSSAIMGISALTLGISQQPIYCDRGLAFWNGLLGVIAKLIWTNCESSFLEFGPTALHVAAFVAGWAVSALSFASLMISYYIASSKRFYDIAILSCICDPISIAVEGVAERLPEPPKVRVPEFVPSLEECVAKLPSYDKTRSFVKRVVDTITPVSLPQRLRALMDTRVY
ncbi:hypothetical protein, conserved [Eimeria praecox]|uniref:Uncharacterized protein n=1 Tax=Eimeria praecox TaxID=51316 RepID=U6G5S8_9EIME|nr:hypothetical protein, conserved [Eimeria praecox]